jgi:kynureninase
MEFITPRPDSYRNGNGPGSQLSMLMLKGGKQVFDELTKQGVIADWREPNVIRIAPVPLYNTFEEVWRFGDIMRNMLTDISKEAR